MTAGMAEIIAAVLVKHKNYVRNDDLGGVICDECGWEVASKGRTSESTTIRMGQHESHVVAAELARAGYGNVQEALLVAADEMPIETLAGADKASAWLRLRAHSLDPVGRALVKAIHDRIQIQLEEWQITVLKGFHQWLEPVYESLVNAGLVEPPLPTDPRERSLYLRKHRNTGPDKPIQEQRRRR